MRRLHGSKKLGVKSTVQYNVVTNRGSGRADRCKTFVAMPSRLLPHDIDEVQGPQARWPVCLAGGAEEEEALVAWALGYEFVFWEHRKQEVLRPSSKDQLDAARALLGCMRARARKLGLPEEAAPCLRWVTVCVCVTQWGLLPALGSIPVNTYCVVEGLG